LIPDANLKRVNKAPTISTLPTANPNPVTGKTADLSLVADDESGESALTYTWSTTAAPAGAPAPTFSANGTNASKNATVTFGRAGTYTIQVAVSDGMLTTTSTLDVIVDQTIMNITVSPSSATVKQNRTQQFTASATDQFGNAVASKVLTWSAQPNGGTITASGLYTAPDVLGNYTVTATAGTVSGTASVNVIDDPAPTVATAAAASPNPTTGTTTQLSVLGADDAGEANLIYTWAATVIPSGSAQPTFSANGTNAAKNVTANSLQAGTYTFVATISDGFESATSSVNVVVSNPSTAPTVHHPRRRDTESGQRNHDRAQRARRGCDTGEASLTYTWATSGTPPAAVTFSANGTNASKNSTATFTRAGAYSFAVTVSDGANNTTSSVNVTVNQTLTSVAVTPGSATDRAGHNPAVLRQRPRSVRAGDVGAAGVCVVDRRERAGRNDFGERPVHGAVHRHADAYRRRYDEHRAGHERVGQRHRHHHRARRLHGQRRHRRTRLRRVELEIRLDAHRARRRRGHLQYIRPVPLRLPRVQRRRADRRPRRQRAEHQRPRQGRHHVPRDTRG
jgi:hypothetical protein